MPVDAYMRHKEAAHLNRPQNLSYVCLLTCASIQQNKLT